MELAQQLNVRVETIQNWEHRRSIPAVSYLSKLIQFLEFAPFETPSTLLKLTEKRPTGAGGIPPALIDDRRQNGP